MNNTIVLTREEINSLLSIMDTIQVKGVDETIFFANLLGQIGSTPDTTEIKIILSKEDIKRVTIFFDRVQVTGIKDVLSFARLIHKFTKG